MRSNEREEEEEVGKKKLTVCSVVGSSHASDQGGHTLTDGIQQLRRHIHAGHHVLEDKRLVLQFSPLARREGSATSSSTAHRRAVVVLQKLLRRLHLVHALLFRRSPSPTQCRCASSCGNQQPTVGSHMTPPASHQSSSHTSPCRPQLLHHACMYACPPAALVLLPPLICKSHT